MGVEVLVGLAVASTVTQVAGSIKSGEQQRKAAQARAGSQAQAATEQRRQKVREQRIRRARIVAASQASGTAGSSSEQGALSAADTSTASNVAFGRSQEGSALAQTSTLQKAQGIRDKTALVGSVFDLASAGVEYRNSLRIG